ncbi:MAG: bifunctional UDP-N-acetylmuramoyl-tripeptide:D-alanyl-D-alanine ligase/alanine racemase [Bacteroidetes bacterium]|nr:MAG: bifunctional UDP-N-acetylmuramoyl-tripeptide:D-alanyl-D-alanine ligase/alanine racemase [Bacteroidota bacterium]
MVYTIKNISSIVHGHLVQVHQDDPVEHLLVDSRRLIFPESTVFFALSGPRRNGHDYIKELYERGVRNFVIYRELPYNEYSQANFILVADTIMALQQLASFHRQQFSIPVIGITGSNGKTIVKEWTNQLLEDEFNIVRSPKSYNSQIGVPLSVWQMNDKNELGIFEAGISQVNEMEKLERMIQPTIGILTNIGDAHNEGFESRRQKIGEKLVLFKSAGTIVYCDDDLEIDAEVKKLPGISQKKLFTWGKSGKSIFQLVSIQKNTDFTLIRAKYGQSESEFRVSFTDEAGIENSISCICLLICVGVQRDAIQGKLNRLSPLSMRLELKNGINHCAVINDSYSVDLSSLRTALDFLSQQQVHKKHTVILSDILQSGKEEKALYNEVARLLRQKNINRLIAIGERISANKDSFDHQLQFDILFFPSTESFISNFHQAHFNDETILLKGARMFQFERIDHLLSQQIHRTVLEISLDAMAHNLKQYQQLLRPSTKIMAMVKAFAYGAGSYEVARLLQYHKVDYLGVAYVDEGVELRKAGIHMPIMVMNTESDNLDALVQYSLEPVIYSFKLLDAVEKFLKKEGINEFPVHVEIETGMNRLGFAIKETPGLIKRLASSACKIQSIFSHLAASEEKEQDSFTEHQADLLTEVIEEFKASIPYTFLKHIANSAAIIRYPQLQWDMVRLGIGLYGIDSASTHRLLLEQTVTLKSTIAQIKKLSDQETIGYNRKGIAQGRTIIATVRIGYADGYPRSLGNGIGKMFLKGKLVPTIGSICMDMTMIDISTVPEAVEGDEIQIFGKELPVGQIAHWAGTIPYEILTGVSQRVKRVYFSQ